MNWLDRQSFLGPDSDAVLENLVIGIVGLGGGGSHVGQQLAHVGIGSFVLADDDVIEDTNLNRLVGGTWADVENATPKVEIARRLIKAVRPDAKVTVHQKDWQFATDDLKRCDVIVGGLDSVRAKDELDAFCRRYLIPYIDMGMDVHGEAGRHLIAGQVVLSSPGTPCLRCLHVVTDEALEREGANYGAAGGKPQVVWPNGVLASTAVGLVMQLVTPWHGGPVESAYLEYDGNLGTVVPSALLKYQSRHPCTHYPATERGDPSFDVRRLEDQVSATPQLMAPQTFWARLLDHVTRLFDQRAR
ncbi:ThiF family adenylyltransferase [Brevundimonas sp.]|uniref:HesA/MoeB/ThiF family protein n=1 Tax=Brevundimonas sp. TaxID=1871086 RepID=UPI0012245842|nr:ThiF family adenylyltransferase [Brevundimonas sp.]TAJ64656.1 MAG: ThiF family adenylyltransferase [Brevundimonas sp.]